MELEGEPRETGRRDLMKKSLNHVCRKGDSEEVMGVKRDGEGRMGGDEVDEGRRGQDIAEGNQVSKP